MKDNVSRFRLDPGSDLGIAAQIRGRAALLIADGVLRPGDRLPPVRGLARDLGASVNTVRAAYARLEDDGLVHTRHGVGTIVATGSVERPAVGMLPPGSNTIAVLIAGLDPFYLDLIRGIEDVAAQQGTLVLVADARESGSLAGHMIGRLAARGVDGIITISIDEVAEPGRRARGRDPRLPIVRIDQPDQRGDSLVFDGRTAGYAATRHLLDHGHERVGLVTAPLEWPNMHELYEGYERALRETGAQVAPDLVVDVGEFSIDAGRAGLARLLDQPGALTAVFATAEVLALGVVAGARARALAIPGNLAVIGYAGTPASEVVEPPLTMVVVPARETGRRAMRMLGERMSGSGGRSRRTVVPSELVLRGSCGAHRAPVEAG
jgi:DNA-binding LacI/PurR family transcriptional regulator